MRKILPSMLLFAVVATAAPLWAATPAEFYLTLLKRGSSEVEAGRNNEALTPLRLAAFGFVDSVEQYETAQVYLAVAYDRLAQPNQAREAATRVVAAERVERRYGTLPLPASIRNAFDAVARKFLASSDIAVLTAPPVTAPQTSTASAAAPPRTTTTQTTTQKPAPATVAGTTDVKPPAVVETPKQPEKPPVKPAPTQTATTQTPPKTAPAPAPVQVKPTPPAPQPQPQPQPARIDVPARLAAADRALTANLAEARRIYRELLAQSTLDRTSLIRVGEGLYRARDFDAALTAFQRLGTLRSGEEPYRYYIAVALYETGNYDRARKELAAALPHIEITPDVARYREKIEGAIN